mmetsp:Transcript_9208/g.38710  ORF Transcript_9208/g.38710 Transcript_9208/m.38710 type:complete len:279 (-) Transcript_9208:41-877(-)
MLHSSSLMSSSAASFAFSSRAASSSASSAARRASSSPAELFCTFASASRVATRLRSARHCSSTLVASSSAFSRAFSEAAAASAAAASFFDSASILRSRCTVRRSNSLVFSREASASASSCAFFARRDSSSGEIAAFFLDSERTRCSSASRASRPSFRSSFAASKFPRSSSSALRVASSSSSENATDSRATRADSRAACSSPSISLYPRMSIASRLSPRRASISHWFHRLESESDSPEGLRGVVENGDLGVFLSTPALVVRGANALEPCDAPDAPNGFL